jgi:molybdate transport system substrate-binding protein
MAAMSTTHIGLIFFAVVLLGQPTPAAGDEIKVFSTQALRTSLLELAPRFEKMSGHKVVLEVAPSGRLAARVREGDRADILIANAANIDRLLAEEKVTGSRIDLARAQVGLAVRAGAHKPDISSPEAVKRALIEANAVAYSVGGLSGNAFEAVLNKLGILDQVKAKAKIGSPAAGFVARGEADIAVQQISELIAVPGAELIGPLPPGLDQVTQFSIGRLAPAKESPAADALIGFLTSAEASVVMKAKGLTPER